MPKIATAERASKGTQLGFAYAPTSAADYREAARALKKRHGRSWARTKGMTEWAEDVLEAVRSVVGQTSPPFTSTIARWYADSFCEHRAFLAAAKGWIVDVEPAYVDGFGADIGRGWRVTQAGVTALAIADASQLKDRAGSSGSGGVEPPAKARTARRDREAMPVALELPFREDVALEPPPSLDGRSRKSSTPRRAREARLSDLRRGKRKDDRRTRCPRCGCSSTSARCAVRLATGDVASCIPRGVLGLKMCSACSSEIAESTEDKNADGETDGR